MESTELCKQALGKVEKLETEIEIPSELSPIS